MNSLQYNKQSNSLDQTTTPIKHYSTTNITTIIRNTNYSSKQTSWDIEQLQN